MKDRMTMPVWSTLSDRNEQAHEANLHDMDAKYIDVVPTEDALKYLEEVAARHAN